MSGWRPVAPARMKLVTSMAERRPPIGVVAERHHDVSILTVNGVLDFATYRGLRDAVIKAALDEPAAVIVDVNALSVLSPSAWSVFTSARWHVSTWPDVQILLVCAKSEVRRAITAGGVARYVPVHPTRESALDAVRRHWMPVRRRARAQLPVASYSVGLARDMIADWLTRWENSELIPVAGTVATVLVQNVLDHTDSAPVLIIESHQDKITVAVEDGSDHPPGRHESPDYGVERVSGLAIVSALCRVWGSSPTSSGKTVWAVIGRENDIWRRG